MGMADETKKGALRGLADSKKFWGFGIAIVLSVVAKFLGLSEAEGQALSEQIIDLGKWYIGAQGGVDTGLAIAAGMRKKNGDAP